MTVKILVFCSYCLKVREEGDHWQYSGESVAEDPNVQFSSAVCPQCYEKYAACDDDLLEEIFSRRSNWLGN